MKIKTTELSGAALDRVVATIEGWAQSFTPSTNWAQGGPIIEREGMRVCEHQLDEDAPIDGWYAEVSAAGKGNWGKGSTPLIAAMRCFVASKLGDEVDVPEELATRGE